MNAAPALAITHDIVALLAAHAPVAIGVSGGKDSQAAALATCAFLDDVGHAGPRLLVHADLGEVEWNASLPTCQALAAHLGVALIVVRRPAGGLMERWEARWQSSRRRYAALETVTLVLPWSTPAMRFCTSELKTHVIAAELRRSFPGRAFVNVTGVRRAESAARAGGAIATREADGRAWSWRPISDWSEAQVFAYVAARGLAVHEAYTRYGMSRVSCRFCIMSSEADLAAAAAAEESRELFARMVDLEIASSFAFQGSRWLADVAPHLLSEGQRAGIAVAKRKAAMRKLAERTITPGMLYVKGWPTRMLTDDEAELLAGVRRTVSGMLGIDAHHLDAASIHGRYAELMAINERRRAA